MKIKKSIIEKINNVDFRRRISAALGIGDQMLYTHLRINKEDGRLTKMDALTVISKEVGISVAEILDITKERLQIKMMNGDVPESFYTKVTINKKKGKRF